MKTLLLIARVLVLALALGTASAPLHAQEPTPVGEVVSDPLPVSSGNQRAYTHLFLAFGIAWVALFGYAVSLNRRFRRLEEQVLANRPT